MVSLSVEWQTNQVLSVRYDCDISSCRKHCLGKHFEAEGLVEREAMTN